MDIVLFVGNYKSQPQTTHKLGGAPVGLSRDGEHMPCSQTFNDENISTRPAKKRVQRVHITNRRIGGRSRKGTQAKTVAHRFSFVSLNVSAFPKAPE